MLLRLLQPVLAFAITFLLSGPVVSELLVQDFNALLRSSDLIVFARPIERVAPKEPSGRGYAVMKVIKVLRGEYSEPAVRIEFENELHEQTIDLFNNSYILFLRRKENQGLTGAHYGSSYWPIEHSRTPEGSFVRYKYPVDNNSLPSEVIRDIGLGSHGGVVRGVTLDDLFALIKAGPNISGAPPSTVND